MAVLRESVDQIIYGPIVVGVGLAILGLQLVVLVIAVRRRRRGAAPPLSLKLHAIAGAWIAVFPVVVGISVHAARASMLRVYAGGDSVDASEKAMALSRGMSGQMNAIPLAISMTFLALVIWFIGLAYTLSAPRSDGRSPSLPPAALVGLGLLPVALGALQWCTGMIKSFAGMAGMPPEAKAAVVEGALEAARAQLTYYARISWFAIPTLAVMAVVLIVVRGRAGAETRAPAPARGASLPLATSAVAVLLAALLVLEVQPTAAENALPWPPTTGSQLVFPGGPPTPDLVGPDAPGRAPVVVVFRDRMTLDGADVDFQELESKLGTLRNNFRLLRPADDFNDMALIEADRGTPIARLSSLLQAVRGAWYYRPMFAFTKTETQVRPVFGKLERVVVTGARFRLAYTDDEPDDDDAAEWKAAVRLRLQDFSDYDALARRLVELRRAGKPVLVRIERSSL